VSRTILTSLSPSSPEITVRLRAIFVSLLLMLPALAFGQYPVRGGMGSGPRRGNADGGSRGPGASNSPAALPTRADLEKQDPIVILLEKKDQLALTDSQVARLVALDAKLMHDNRLILREIDSLHADMAAGEGRDGIRAESDPRREIVQRILGLRANDQTTAADALALLDESQRTKAAKLINEETDRLEKARAKGGEARAQGGGRRPPNAR
jgi:hypothetical protein